MGQIEILKLDPACKAFKHHELVDDRGQERHRSMNNCRCVCNTDLPKGVLLAALDVLPADRIVVLESRNTGDHFIYRGIS